MIKMRNDRLPLSQKVFYGFGHVLNDMCASLWFNYLLVYLHSVLRFTNAMAGTLLLIGQIADGISTPIVGMESDRSPCSSCYPRRKSWHLFGTIMVVCSFIFVFNPCLVCTEYTSDWAKFIYFAPIIVIFQIGWAATQIAHLSLIPDLSYCESLRVELTSIRYGFTVVSNFVVFGSAWLLITFLNPTDVTATDSPLNSNNGSWIPVTHDRLSPADIPIFRYLAIILVSLGSIFSIGFHLGIKEPRMTLASDDIVVPVPADTEEPLESNHRTYSDASVETPSENSVSSPRETDVTEQSMLIRSSSIAIRMKPTSWLKEPVFYLVGCIYVCVRLITNISLVYMSLYINDTLLLNKIHVALVPLSVYAVSLIASVVQKKLNKWVGRKITLCTGFVVTLAYSVSLYFVGRPTDYVHLYATALLLGIGTSILMVGSLSLTADTIGNELSTSAFVYGAMSFGDKVFNGIVVEVIQLIHPNATCSVTFTWFYRSIEVFFIGGVAIFGLVLVFCLMFVNVKDLRFYRNRQNSISVNPDVPRYGSTQRGDESSSDRS